MSNKNLAIQDGLTSYKTYVVLWRNARQGVHLALRPNVIRDKDALLLGGTLRIAYDYASKGTAAPRKGAFSEMSNSELRGALRDLVPNSISWTRGNELRNSSYVALPIAVPYGTLNEFKALWDERDYVGELLNAIRDYTGLRISGVPQEGGKDFAVKELVKRYEELLSDQALYESERTNKLPEGVFGNIGEKLLSNVNNYSGLTTFLNDVAKEAKQATKTAA